MNIGTLKKLLRMVPDDAEVLVQAYDAIDDEIAFYSAREFTIRFSHAKYCRNRKNDTIIRQHNSFVMRYVYGYSCRDIAKKQILNPRTVPRDIDAVFRDLMVLVYGVDGLRQKPENSDACNEGSDKDCLFKKQLQQKF